MFGKPKFRVEGTKPSALDKGPKKPQTPEEAVEQLMTEVKGMLASYETFFTTFAEDVSLKFVPSNAFYIDLEKGDVNLDIKWFYEQGYGKEEIIWAVFHELSHFRDLAKDPKRMMANFEYIKRRAKKTAVSINNRMKEIGQSPSTTGSERIAYKMHHTFYNIFDDIYVNNMVSERAPKYDTKGAGGKTVKNLYREKLFPGTDYSTRPRHMQFLYSLLRGEMVPDEKLQLHPDVQELLDTTEIIHEKRKHSLREFVDKFLKPQSKADTRAGERYKLLQKYIEPIYEKLIAQDLAEWKPQEPEENKDNQNNEDSESGDGSDSGDSDESQGDASQGTGQPKNSSGKSKTSNEQPFEKEYAEFEKRHIDQMDEKEFEKFTKEEVKKEAEKTAEDEAKKAQEKMDKEWCEENNISPEQLKKFRDIEKEINPHLADLTALWQRIVYGSGTRLERTMKTGFRRGTDLDIGRTVEQWPDIQSGHMDDATIMRRMSVEERPVKKPELIRVRVLADNSSSMGGAKLQAQDKAIALILSSLDEFNTYLNQNRSETGSALRVETELWGFDARAKVVKSTGSGDPSWNERAAMVRTMGQIDGLGGSTNDAGALQNVIDQLSSKEKEDIKAGETLEIVFVMTDGGANDPVQTKKRVEALDATGVVVRSFQIGNVSPEERASFETAWNQGRSEKFGAVVGSQVGNLVPAVAEVLKKHLRNVEL